MLKVLIVDDDANVTKGLKMLVPWESLGYEVVGTAPDGETGYQLAIRHSPDLIISDIRMPNLDGTEFLKRVRETLLDVEFIFLSAYESFPAAQLAMKYHVRGYLLKPIDRAKLQTLAEYLLDIRRGQEKVRFYRADLFEKDSPLFQAIQDRDRPYFDALFRGMLEDALKMVDDTGMIRSACIRLVNEMRIRWGAAFLLQSDVDLEQIKKKVDLVLAVADACYSYIDQDYSGHPLLADVCQYVARHLNQEDLNIDAIAAALNYSRSYVGRVFQKFSGMSIVDYIAMKRVERAAQLLTTTEKSINVIAAQVGFHTPSYFTQVFKKSIGCLPSEYRAQARRGRVGE